MPASKPVSTTCTGHFSIQMPQPVQSASTSMRGLCLTLILKSPTEPETSTTSLQVWSVMFLWAPASTILGVRMQAAQSSVGKVLSYWAMCPPIDGSRSTMCTG